VNEGKGKGRVRVSKGEMVRWEGEDREWEKEGGGG
jgi:hypothetical protein